MLHEIFKGMDNSAEQIDDNFKNGSIVEHNLDETNPERGYYVRYGNGLQICWHNLEVSVHTSIAMGAAYRSESITWDYPKPFIEPPFFDPKSSIAYGRWGVVLRKPEKETAYYGIMAFINTSALNGVHLLAIGRWKE